MHRARAALRDAAAVFGAGKPDDVAEHPEQRHVRRSVKGSLFAIDGQRRCHKHTQVLRPRAAARGEYRKYRAAASQEARIFSAMLICIADAAHHTIVQRACISFNRTDMIVVI
jgi:hypothetical protein